jgi:predicted nucleic acid-binding protein
MIIVCDMGPLHYLVLIGTEHVLPRLFTRVLAPPAVIAEMSHADAPEAVRLWASSPPPWLEIKEPDLIEEIPALGRKGSRGAGEKAAIALARQEGADAILMDDKDGQREARKRGLRPVWMLTVLDQAAAQGLVSDLPERLDQLVQKTSFYVGRECRQVIEVMKQRDRGRALVREQRAPGPTAGD